jgi:hypothetical protein
MNRLIATAVLGWTLALAGPAQRASAQDIFRPVGGDRQVQQIVARIRTEAETLQRTLNSSRQDEAFYLVDDIVQASDHLADHLTRRQVVRLDVEDLLRRGAELDNAFSRLRPSRQVESSWAALRRDMDSLAAAYGMNWDWRNPTYSPSDSRGSLYQGLTGTYRLDRQRSDDPQRIASQSLRQLSPPERARIVNRLEAPEEIAIERVNGQVTLASSQAPRLSFDADGRPRAERGVGGRNMTTRAEVYGDRLEVTTSGDAETEYTAIFEPLENGQVLRVTKRLFVGTAQRPVEVQSFYRRASEIAEWNIYRGPTARNRQPSQYEEDGSLPPNGTMLTATLDEPLNLRAARQDDRITLTVRNAPSTSLEGAVVEGYVTATASRFSDREGVSFDLNQIRFRNGRTARFDGTVDSIRGPNGEPISFNGEQVSNDSTQRDQAIQRGAIGAAVGAVIGAVAGGGKGAAIGAVLGGGGAAATVLLKDQGQPNLPRGTEFTIRMR